MIRYLLAIALLVFFLKSPGEQLHFPINQASDSITITLEAINLSEDMSTLSSRNDEILILIYDYTDSIKLGKPLVKEYLEIDSAHRTSELKVIKPKSQIVLFLIEIDSNRTPDQIEKTFRINHARILNTFKNKDLTELHKIIGDEDILGTSLYDISLHKKSKTFIFKGRSKLDKFHYQLIMT